MCGIAEATLAISAVSAIAGYAGAQEQVNAQAEQQAAVDRAAYANYANNISSINQQNKELREASATQQMSQAVEQRIAEGRSRVHFGETGLGQMALTGNSVDAHFNDILFQSATGRATMQQDLKNRQGQLNLQANAAYNSYLAQNASFTPLFNPSPLEPIMKIASAGVDFAEDPTRTLFRNSGTTNIGGLTA
tara:strand:+ start:5959 stop:6534 length:576 start_codon:yes stop_codon:yes gene_type:complete